MKWLSVWKGTQQPKNWVNGLLSLLTLNNNFPLYIVRIHCKCVHYLNRSLFKRRLAFKRPSWPTSHWLVVRSDVCAKSTILKRTVFVCEMLKHLKYKYGLHTSWRWIESDLLKEALVTVDVLIIGFVECVYYIHCIIYIVLYTLYTSKHIRERLKCG